jgi:hypothetical protein
MIAGLLVVLGTLISWERLPAGTRDTLWAEDVRNFLSDAVKYGPLPALTHSYAGYLHTVPRVIAGLTMQLVPVSGWAVSMTLGACLVTGIVAGLVYVTSGTIIAWMPARIALAAITFLVPLAPREVLGNTANLHWYFLWLAPWLLLYRPATRAASWIVAVAALFAALTEIQMALFIPLMLWQHRDRRRVPIRALFLLGIALQVVATLIAPRGSSGASPIGPLSLGYGYLINCVMTILSPNPAVLGPLLVQFGPVVGLVLLLPFVGLLVYALRRGSSVQRILAAVLAAGSVALYVIAVEISPGTFYDYAAESSAGLAVPWLARYGVVPSMFLLALAPLAVTVWWRRRNDAVGHAADGAGEAQPVTLLRRLGRNRSRLVVLVALLAVMLVGFSPASTRRSNGPQWQPQVARQQAWCVGRSPLTRVTLAGAPSSGWKLAVTCAELAPLD